MTSFLLEVPAGQVHAHQVPDDHVPAAQVPAEIS